MHFLIGRDPRLSLTQLFPSFSSFPTPCPIQGRQTLYHFWARSALYHGLRFLGLEPGQKVLVPAYHCATLVDPILEFGGNVIFYNVLRDGSPDFQDIQSKIDKRTRALVAIHFFGIPQPIKKIRDFCNQNQLFLIEDCAHILIGEVDGTPLGSFGDVSIFSWRKFLPLYDGGLLVLNNPQCHVDIDWDRSDVWFQLKIAKNLFENVLGDYTRWAGNISSFAQAASWLIRGGRKKNGAIRKAAAINSYSASFDSSLANLPMSWFSQNILKRMDFPSICEKRQRNSMTLLNAISSWPEVRPWVETISEKVCGWGFPLVVPEREDVHLELRSKGIQAFTWEGVIHPSLPLKNFPDAEFLYRHLVILPNHQDLSEEDVLVLVNTLQEITRKSNSKVPFTMQ